MDTKSKVLSRLEESKGAPVSGSAIARDLEISRTAVWKAINSLREEGHLIDSSSGRGYTLATESDRLSREGIASMMAFAMDAGLEIHVMDSIDSTNKEAKRLAIGEPDNVQLIVANQQTEGRGRLGRSFYSPADTGVYMSFLFRPSFTIDKAPLATCAAAVAVTKAIRTVTGKQCQIKWVNDVYYNDKKICGILTEGVTGIESRKLDYIIVGIGINCHPADLSAKAGSRAGDLGGGLTRNQLVARIADELLPLISKLDPDVFMPYYSEHSMVLGKKIRIFKGGFDGASPEEAEEPAPSEGAMTALKSGALATAVNITKDGGLVVAYEDGRKETLTSGEISIRRMDSDRTK